MASPLDDPFPRQQARTRRFSLGAPRNFTVSPDGDRVVFLRSAAGDDPATSLWVYDRATGTEREVASAARALGDRAEHLTDEERARRERSRELAAGIVAYACDDTVSHAAFALGGKLWWVSLAGGGGGDGGGGGGAGTGLAGPAELAGPGGAVDPRPSPTGRHVAFRPAPAFALWPRTAGKTTGPWPRKPGKSPGGRPSSLPPKRWDAPGASGGRPTVAPCWPPGSTTAR